MPVGTLVRRPGDAVIVATRRLLLVLRCCPSDEALASLVQATPDIGHRYVKVDERAFEILVESEFAAVIA